MTGTSEPPIQPPMLPCPFCGDAPYDVLGGMPQGYGVVCPHCDYRGPEDITPERAVERWNTRAHPTPDLGGLLSFVESIGDVSGPYHDLDGHRIVADSRAALRQHYNDLEVNDANKIENRIARCNGAAERVNASQIPDVRVASFTSDQKMAYQVGYGHGAQDAQMHRQTEPVSVSLKKCVAAFITSTGDKNGRYPHNAIKAVLDAAGVKYG